MCIYIYVYVIYILYMYMLYDIPNMYAQRGRRSKNQDHHYMDMAQNDSGNNVRIHVSRCAVRVRASRTWTALGQLSCAACKKRHINGLLCNRLWSRGGEQDALLDSESGDDDVCALQNPRLPRDDGVHKGEAHLGKLWHFHNEFFLRTRRRHARAHSHERARCATKVR